MQSATLVKAYAALAAVCFFWGTTYLAIRIGVDSMPPFLFAGVRFLIAGGLVCLYFILKKTPLPSLQEWKNILLISVLFFVIGNSSVVHAEQHISSGLAALICSAIPIWVVLINLVLSKAEKVNSLIVMGLIVGFGGLMMIFYDNLGDLSNPALLISILFLLFGNLTWSYGTVYSKKVKWSTPFMYAAGLQMLVAGIILSVAGLFSGEAVLFHPTFNGWMALLYLAVIGSVLSYGAYLYALSHLPSTVVSLYAYVNPIVAVAFGYLVLHEQFGFYTLLAMVITIAGVYLVNAGFKVKQNQPAFLRKLSAVPALLKLW
ncbi:MAG TPA: EamA family transporter [Chitinophagales bacterium]|nr:EamA family transporter [Chitinophagales bacterium]